MMFRSSFARGGAAGLAAAGGGGSGACGGGSSRSPCAVGEEGRSRVAERSASPAQERRRTAIERSEETRSIGRCACNTRANRSPVAGAR